MKLTIFGTGYVGLVQAAVFAGAGHHVLCIDRDEERIAALKRGETPIYEPGLEELLEANIKSGRLTFSTQASDGIRHSSVHFIAVGTPSQADGSADLQYVLQVARTVAGLAEQDFVLINKSTVPVGTAKRVREEAVATLSGRSRNDIRVEVISNPEFLKEGAAIADCQKPDRIIVGAETPDAELLMREIYAPFNRNHDKFHIMDPASAELTKYAANCMLASRISLMNEFARLADRCGADIEQIRRGIGADPRIGPHFIYPGLGYGGSCFPKDVRALIQSFDAVGEEPLILKAVNETNKRQPAVMIDKIVAKLGPSLDGCSFALWGLAFKPGTDDVREAAALEIARKLIECGATVRAYDPVANDNAQKSLQGYQSISFHDSAYDALQGCDALILGTEWKEFASPDFPAIKNTLRRPIIFDGRNIYDPLILRKFGLTVIGIGRGSLSRSS